MRWSKRRTIRKLDYMRKLNRVESEETPTFTCDLGHNEDLLRKTFRNCADVEYRKIGDDRSEHCLVVYIENLIDKKMLDEHVIKPLLTSLVSNREIHDVTEFMNKTLPVGSMNISRDAAETTGHILEGYAAVLTQGSCKVLTVSLPGTSHRSIEESSTEPVIRGAKDGFIEQLSTNLSLIRLRLKTPKLKIEYITLGEHTRTRVAVLYLEGIAQDSLVDEVRRRVKPIQLNGVVDSEYIEECIEDQPFSPFPQLQSTERPDVVTAELLEGRVAILVDTSPFALVAPMTLWSGLQASEDYYIRWPIATFVRWIRFLFVNFAIFAPSLYVAITTFHQEMIPTNLVLSIAAAREGVPFPAMIEALLLELTFEALREAGIRLPKTIGQAISIVGGIVIGQAAVQAGFISSPVVIIVSITGISSFVIPRYSFANGIRLLRFPMLFLAGALGLYGIVLGYLLILLHLTSLRSFGMLYLSPIVPIKFTALRDILVRVPIWANSRFKPKFHQEGANE
ncbi:spore germination protein KA [Paenibacillus taihuensis]|uniref:Spore germination protein KA n=1 Tax=Paenibacillus taihuensis TaxID=1156355 RepID=A0A3D9QWW5_9BACL|nr:spore germination protein [Paenibacillus taihuensis]REE69714.1 spore germination protein KA [Paenibacillus taihuensis]